MEARVGRTSPEHIAYQNLKTLRESFNGSPCKELSDSTRISIAEMGDLLDCSVTLKTDIVPSINFHITPNGLEKLSIAEGFVKKPKITIMAGNSVVGEIHYESHINLKASDELYKGAEPMVKWAEEMIKENKFLDLPISIEEDKRYKPKSRRNHRISLVKLFP